MRFGKHPIVSYSVNRPQFVVLCSILGTASS